MNYNALMVFDVESDGHTLSASPAMVTTLPVDYLRLPGSAYAARSTSTATQYIYGELASAADVSGRLAALFGTFTSAATVQIILYAGAGRVGEVYNSGALAVSPKGKAWFHVFTGTGLFLSYEIILVDPDNADGYHQLSRLMIGPYWRPQVNILPGYSYTANTLTKQVRTAGGGLSPSPGGSFRDFSFEFKHLTEPERAGLDSMLEYVGMHRDWFLALRPEHSAKYDFSRVVMFTEMPPVGLAYYNHFSAPFKVSEALGGQIATLAVSAPVSPPVITDPGTGAIGTSSGYWIVMLNGWEGATTLHPAASNGNGIIVSVYSGNVIQRSTDYGITFTSLTVPGVPLNLTDVCWTGDRFALCGDSGDMYWSTDGSAGTWTQVHSDAAGAVMLSHIAGIDGALLAVGAVVYALIDGVYIDFTILSGWIGRNSSTFVVNDPDYIFIGDESGNRLFRYDVVGGVMTNFIPAGLPSANYVAALYARGFLAVIMSDGNLYYSANAGNTFSLWLSPPNNYKIYDFMLTRRFELLVVMERDDGDANQRRIFSYIGGFTELRVRITYDGRQMLLHESVRELAFDITDSLGGVLDVGIDTYHIAFRAVDSDGLEALIPYQITAPGEVTWSANQSFTGKITLTVSGTVLEQSL